MLKKIGQVNNSQKSREEFGLLGIDTDIFQAGNGDWRGLSMPRHPIAVNRLMQEPCGDLSLQDAR